MEPERSSPAVAVPDAKATLNGILKNVVQHLLDGVPHANFFRNPVSCVVVDDYRDYVPAGQDMCLGRILERTESQYYSDVAAFRADLQLMYDNAAAYNGRNGGKHAYEPVIHWAANMLAAAYKELCHSMPLEAPNTGEQKPPCHTTAQLGVPTVEAAWDPTTAPSAPSADAADATERPSGGSIPPRLSPIDQCNDIKPSPLRPTSQEHLLAKSQHPQQPDQQPQADQRTLDPMQQQQQQQHAQQRISVAGNGQGSPRAANGSSAGQQSSSPSSGSGAGSHSGLEALLAACELAAEQDSAAPRGDTGVAAAAAAVGVGTGDVPPERHSFPGCSGQSKQSEQPEQQQQQAEDDDEEHQQQELALVAFEPTHDGCAGPGLMSAGKSQQQREDPAGSSEGGGMELCCLPSGGGSGGGPEGTATMAQAGGSGGGGREIVVAGGGGGGAGGSYLASNAFKNRRHKSKVYIKPNKVVYLPTTFVEEEFDVSALPLDCELRVEADGALTDETFRVTIKAVPRQGLSTMYCMTNVMRFQQQYLNWQIYNWTRIDNTHIKIHLQSPSPSQTHLQRPDLDRSASMPEVGRNFPFRASEDGTFGYQARGAGGAVAASSLKRKSDTGRYNVTRVERRLAPEPGREILPLELRLSSTGYAQYPSPIPESPPASPQRRMSACPASTAAVVGMGAALPPRAPANHGAIPTRLSGAQQFSLQPQQSHHHHQQQQIHQQQIQIHHHHHYTGGHFQNQPIQSLYHQQHSHSHSHPHPPHSGSGVNANNPLSLPFSIGQIQQPQVQRGSNSSILTKQDQQTCSEDSSGPVVGADVAPGGGPMQLAWHPSAPAGGGNSGTRSARFSGAAAAARTAAVLQPLDVHDLAEQLQVQAKATGGELSALGALQLAIVALQQQQQQQHSLLMAALPRGSADGAGGGGGGIAPLDLANAVDQERLLQQLALGALAHPHARAPRWSTGRLDSIDGAPDMEFGGQRGPSSAGALDAYSHQQQPTASSHLYHDEQQQHRRSSQGERSRQGVAAPQGCKQAGHQQQQHGNEDNLTAASDAVPDAAARVAAAHAVEQQLGGVTMEVEGQQHPPRYARHSVTGTGLHVVSGGAGATNKMFPANIGSLVSTGGRIRFDVGPAPSGAVTAMGPRASASGRRLPGGGSAASIVSDVTDHLAQAAGVSLAAATAFPGGLDLPDCNAADIISLLSPTKRYKVSVSTDNTGAAVGGGGGQELPVLDMLSGLRAAAAAAAAAGARSLQTEAALTALRLGGGGQQAANALNGRSFLPVGPEILGQLM
ncbi:hypothetical protein Vretimale_10328 [Volvox reticuliferus]|uniref:Bromo domain-containing protein n=1 Tax=Volvox reticuliferus TaxID=1737510 RepID=A0A8J4GED7_9CHLO|nr:hypothetical protein Vretifemale_12346 [Volvox reticuliferus]GIM05953.1 hypothetical protein Vretimale_10328 [Volvox reticuliferus]